MIGRCIPVGAYVQGISKSDLSRLCAGLGVERTAFHARPLDHTRFHLRLLADRFKMKFVVGLGNWVLCRQDLLDAC
jgi:hypothetical protein